MPQNVPTHPGREASQQGLAPQAAPVNPYFAPSQALQSYNSDMQVAQARQADAAAAKANAEAALIQQAQGLGSPQVQPDPAMQLAEGIASGQLGEAELQAMAQSGQVDPAMIQQAVAMVQQAEAPAQPQPGGLGNF